jgi:hypothetical protein
MDGGCIMTAATTPGATKSLLPTKDMTQNMFSNGKR